MIDKRFEVRRKCCFWCGEDVLYPDGVTTRRGEIHKVCVKAWRAGIKGVKRKKWLVYMDISIAKAHINKVRDGKQKGG